ncbi:unnamed protein product [Cuscuta campestris]|uniref:Beta-galactosidase n=1 Tax=Cuscuta campestris TaxID=132261 RepID=A0A484L3K4_9ASTE|nr:unnamed protein product [Cuscuta campestris]
MRILLLSVLAFVALAPVTAPLPSLSSPSSLPISRSAERTFEIADDMFWKDGQPFRIIGGDVHYFRILPEFWEDRLWRAKALGLNAIQTYVAWNVHEPIAGQFVFQGSADIFSFLSLCQKLDLLVMLRIGPYICAEWDLGGFPAWLLAIEPALRLRSSDPAFITFVERWWGVLLPKLTHSLYKNGGPIVMVQIENEFGSYGDDKAYLHHLVRLARRHLGDDVILYTTDGGTRENLEKGTIPGDAVFSSVDFSTGDDPWAVFKLQKEFNAPGKSPPLSSEFYTGWLTHWGEKVANTDSDFTASSLENILAGNGSVVLYMAHGGTNFGFYSGANTGSDESDYKPDLTSYDYDAPIKESGDVDNPKYEALQKVIAKYSTTPLYPVPSNNEKKAYGCIKLGNIQRLFDVINFKDVDSMITSEYPLPMESLGQMFGFVLYVSDFAVKGHRSILSIPKVHDRAQVFLSCPSDSNEGPIYIGTIMRWSSTPISFTVANCTSRNRIYILVENMGHLNYGPYIFDRKGILSSVYIDGRPLKTWRMLPVPLHNLNEDENISYIIPNVHTNYLKAAARSVHKRLKTKLKIGSEPAFYTGQFSVQKAKDTYISLRGWSKGVAFVNGFNIGRFWPSFGPQCNLYVPAPILVEGKNLVVILELERANPDLSVTSVEQPDFTCGSTSRNVHNSDINHYPKHGCVT